MTYCVALLVDSGMVFASDSRTHAGLDDFASFCKMTLFERSGDRVIVLLSSGSLAITQAVISLLRQRADGADGGSSVWTARTMFDVMGLVSEAIREIELRDGRYLKGSGGGFSASFLVGGQIRGEAPRLFRMYSEGNFIEATEDTPYLQTGEAKYGKPIIDRVIDADTTLAEAAKCVLVSFDSTMRSNLSVGMPIDLILYERDSLAISHRRRFHEGDTYFKQISEAWSSGVRQVFRELPELLW